VTAPFDILATTNFGLESVAVRELSLLGSESKGHSTGRVLFRGDMAAIAQANLWLRSAGRVLIRVMHFPARDFEALFETVKAFAWEEWIPKDFAFPVNGRSVKSQLSSVPACQRAVKKAIVERLMAAHHTSTLPETGPRVILELEILEDMVTIAIDSSGAGLNKRGYRPMVGDAGLKETMAAGLVSLSVWRPHRALIDPFCGTGTIAIEAAMLARNIAPGLKREFDAEHWSPAWKSAFDAAREKAQSAPRGELAYTIHASDIDERSLKQARYAAHLAGVEKDIHFKALPFEQLSSKVEYGCVITNPPWGIRLETDEVELERLYRQMPLVFRRMPTWSFHILTGRLDLEQIFGQPATRRRKFYTGGIEAWYFTFLGPKPKREEDRGERGEEEERNAEKNEEASVDEKELEVARHVVDDGLRDDSGAAKSPTELMAAPPVEPRVELHSELEQGSADQIDNNAAEDYAETEAVAANTAAVAHSSNLQSSAPRSSAPTQPSPRSISSSAFGGLRDRDARELDDFRSRLTKNAQHLRKYPSRGITCYRVYERDCPDVPLIVDIYEGRVHIAEYEREHSRTLAQQADWWDAVRRIASEVLGAPLHHVYTKEKRRQRGLSQHEKQDTTGESYIVHEGGLKFEVNLRDYMDTGLFLDHRLTRKMVGDQAKGKRFLNLFCYTGAFTVYAAAAGAKSTVSVDLSNTYLDWAERNLRHNGLWGQQHTFVRDDVMEFLAKHPKPRPGMGYDLAVVDPPTFSNSKSTEIDWEVAQTHPDLLRMLVPLMEKGGVIYFSTNYRRFKLNEDALKALGLSWREISKQTVPPEYRNERIHRCWRLVVE
jgi:23S rRNA (guanine2445-N2)-methyltransferase / 23S rRNA (guanine2069-N7)-methyltransferase